ncbi:MAG: hypothetical protein Q9163_003816 [Psora crenata]
MGPSTRSYTAPNDLPQAPINTTGLRSIRAKANVAVDMFLDADSEKSQSSTAAAYETMIWIGTVGGTQPFHSLNTSDPPTQRLDGTTFSLFVGPNQSNQTVYTWLADKNLTSLSAGTDFSPLLRYLYRNDLLPASTFLGTLQVGSETYHAQRKVQFQIMDLNMTVGRNTSVNPAGSDNGQSGTRSDAPSGKTSSGSMALCVWTGIWLILLGAIF